MSVNLKTSKPRMFSTVLDVIRKGRMIRTDTIDFTQDDAAYTDNVVLHDGEIESYIINQDGIILTYLNQIYGGAAGLRTTRWTSTPYRSPSNQGRPKLLVATLNDTENPYTAYWEVKFTSATEFKVTSSLEGSQGTGATNADFTSSNTELSIGTNAWVDDDEFTFTENDRFYFSVIDVFPIINKLSSDLSAAAVLMELYSEAVPNANEYASRLYDDAMKLLDKLADANSDISLTTTIDYDTESTPVDYHVNALGEDESDYLTENTLDL
jgi:hypothetical protein